MPHRDGIRHSFFRNGYGPIVQRDGKRVAAFHLQRSRLEQPMSADITAALRNRNSSFVIDGETVLLGVDAGQSSRGLHSRKHDDEATFYVFDMAGAFPPR